MLYAEAYGRLLLLAMKQVTWSLLAFVNYCAEKELESRARGNVLEAVEYALNEEKFFAVQSA